MVLQTNCLDLLVWVGSLFFFSLKRLLVLRLCFLESRDGLEGVASNVSAEYLIFLDFFEGF